MKQYLKFDGYATRSEFWGVYVISVVLGMISGAVVGVSLAADFSALLVISGIAMLAVMVLGTWAIVATAVRRCNDAGINPWWVAAGFIPYIGAIVWIVIGVLKPAAIK